MAQIVKIAIDAILTGVAIGLMSRLAGIPPYQAAILYLVARNDK